MQNPIIRIEWPILKSARALMTMTNSLGMEAMMEAVVTFEEMHSTGGEAELPIKFPCPNLTLLFFPYCCSFSGFPL